MFKFLCLSALFVFCSTVTVLQARTLVAQEKLRQKHAKTIEKEDSDLSHGMNAPLDTDKITLRAVAADGTVVDDDRLRDFLREYSERYPALMGVAGQQMHEGIIDGDTSYLFKRDAITWQYSSITEVQNICMQPNPRVALIDLATYTTRAAAMIRGETGKKQLGPYQSFFEEAMDKADQWAWWLVGYVLNKKDYDAVHEEVMAWSEKFPMTSMLGRQKIGSLAGDRFNPPPSQTIGGGGLLSGVSTGIDSTVTELKQANRTLDNFYVLMDWMPVYAYWMFQIGYYNFLDSPEGKAVVKFGKEVGETQIRLGSLADYFKNIDKVVQPFADKMAESEYQDLPDKMIKTMDRVDELSTRLLALEEDLDKLVNDAAGKPLGQRIATIDTNMETLSQLTGEVREIKPSLVKLGNYADTGEDLFRQAELLLLKAGALLFVCLILYKFIAIKMENKLLRKRE